PQLSLRQAPQQLEARSAAPTGARARHDAADVLGEHAVIWRAPGQHIHQLQLPGLANEWAKAGSLAHERRRPHRDMAIASVTKRIDAADLLHQAVIVNDLRCWVQPRCKHCREDRAVPPQRLELLPAATVYEVHALAAHGRAHSLGNATG